MKKQTITIGDIETSDQQVSHEKEFKIENTSTDLVRDAVRWEYEYGKFGLVLSLITLCIGAVLTLNGVFGKISWVAKVWEMESHLNDAFPGTVLFIIGLFFAFITRPKVIIGNITKKDSQNV